MTCGVLEVTLDPKSAGSRAQFTYRDDNLAELGDAVLVPVGKRTVLGFVTQREVRDVDSLGFPPEELKSICEVVKGVRLPVSLLRLAQRVADTTLSPFPVALSVCLPPGVRDRIQGVWSLGSVAEKPKLNPVEQEVLKLVSEAEDQEVPEEQVAEFDEPLRRAFSGLRTKGILQFRQRIRPFSERRQTEKLVRLGSDERRIEQFIQHEGHKKPAQALTLMRLQAAGGPPLSTLEVRALAGVTESTIRALLQAGLLEPVAQATPVQLPSHTPNPAQQLGINAITTAIRESDPQTYLLFGVTGSGKTEVYLRAAAEALAQGRQVLYLVPEIALATQAIAQMRSRFGRGVAVLHSELTTLERLRVWTQIESGEVSVVLGPRSALFAPLRNLGLIVVDEEHESAYKQEQSPRYHARTIATALSQLHKCPLVLGSATPSLETFQAAESGQMTLISLPSRAASATLPEIQVCDLRENFKSGKPSILVPDLEEAIRQALDQQEQVILFLNRRAYSPFLLCRDCGHRPNCSLCSVALSYHRGERKLRCHQCGFTVPAPVTCPSCQGVRLQPLGLGTEKLEEQLATIFPDARIGRLDRDVARKKGALESVLSNFRSHQLDVLIGTQMVAKGLDFPRVTVVGVIAADISLGIPDFRSGERTFQLLSQVAGRAGRGSLPGRVFVQTFNPDHAAIQFAQRHDYVGFFEQTIRERESLNYPPYSQLINIIVSGSNRAEVQTISAKVREVLPESVTILGPVDCPIERLNGKWRRHLLIKASLNADLRPLGHAVAEVRAGKSTIVIDVNPASLS